MQATEDRLSTRIKAEKEQLAALQAVEQRLAASKAEEERFSAEEEEDRLVTHIKIEEERLAALQAQEEEDRLATSMKAEEEQMTVSQAEEDSFAAVNVNVEEVRLATQTDALQSQMPATQETSPLLVMAHRNDNQRLNEAEIQKVHNTEFEYYSCNIMQYEYSIITVSSASCTMNALYNDRLKLSQVKQLFDLIDLDKSLCISKAEFISCLQNKNSTM